MSSQGARLVHDCILLAAGTSSRMGRPKQLVQFAGKPLILHALETALGCCRRVIVVEGAVSLSSIIPSTERVRLIRNPAYADGQLGSLQKGLAAHTSEFAFIMLADLPLVSPATYREIARRGEGAQAAYPVAAERRGHPVFVGPQAIEAILQADPTQRAMQIIRPFAPLAVEVDDPGIYLDADTPEALETLRRYWGEPKGE